MEPPGVLDGKIFRQGGLRAVALENLYKKLDPDHLGHICGISEEKDGRFTVMSDRKKTLVVIVTKPEQMMLSYALPQLKKVVGGGGFISQSRVIQILRSAVHASDFK